MSEETLNKILAKVVDMDHYMRENVATKDELRATEDKLVTHIDGFIKLHECGT